MKPNYTAHNLKKKTRKQHISGYARATQIMVSIPAEFLYWFSEHVVIADSPLFFAGRSHPSLFVICT